jgi:hypothetical protein
MCYVARCSIRSKSEIANLTFTWKVACRQKQISIQYFSVLTRIEHGSRCEVGESSAENEIDCEVVLLSTSRKLSISFRVIDIEQVFVEGKM